MATLETRRFTFVPDMKTIEKQCESVVARDPRLAGQVKNAMKCLDEVRVHVDSGEANDAFRKLGSLQSVFGLGLDEFEASYLFYTGHFAFASNDNESGAAMLNAALSKTTNSLLIMMACNRLMIYHLTNENFDVLENLALATETVVSRTPESDVTVYFGSAAEYSRAESLFRRERYSAVIPHVRNALKGFQRINMLPEAAKCEGMLGNALILTNETETGLKHTQASLELFRRLGNDGEIGSLLQGRGLAMSISGHKDLAIRDLREALSIFRRRGEARAVNSILATIASLDRS